MKKEKKIALLRECADKKQIARVYFDFDPNYFYYYPSAVNDKFFLAQEEDDFLLDGFHIRKLSHATKVEIKDDLCPEINVWNGVVDQIRKPEIDISSWQTIFTGLQNEKGFIIIRDERNDEYAIGTILKVCKHHLTFRQFGADGIWQEEPLTIPYSAITLVAWNTRYAENWKGFLDSRSGQTAT